MFNFEVFNNSMTLLINTKEQIFVEKLSSLLKHGIRTTRYKDVYDFYYLILAGFAMSVGVVVPGVSSTIILMLMGVYSIYLSSVASLNFTILFPIGIGLFFGCIFFMFVTKFLLKHFYCQTFFSIIGFTIGSIVVILPEIDSVFSFFIASFCCILGFLASFA